MKLKERFDKLNDELSATFPEQCTAMEYNMLEAKRAKLRREIAAVGGQLYRSMEAAAMFASGREVGMRLVSELFPEHEVDVWWFDPNEPCDRHAFNYYNGRESFEAYDPEWGFEVWVKPVEYLTR